MHFMQYKETYLLTSILSLVLGNHVHVNFHIRITNHRLRYIIQKALLRFYLIVEGKCSFVSNTHFVSPQVQSIKYLSTGNGSTNFISRSRTAIMLTKRQKWPQVLLVQYVQYTYIDISHGTREGFQSRPSLLSRTSFGFVTSSHQFKFRSRELSKPFALHHYAI